MGKGKNKADGGGSGGGNSVKKQPKAAFQLWQFIASEFLICKYVSKKYINIYTSVFVL